MAGPFNPASSHYQGASARAYITKARDRVCELIGGAYPEGVIFTSGGTEGNNTIISGLAADPSVTVVTSAVEHSSVRNPATAVRHVEVRVSADGLLDPGDVAHALPLNGPAPLVAFQWANGETGIIQPVSAIVEAVRLRRPDAFILADAAQAVGRVPVSMDGIDALTCSGHKLHGPGGTGVLVLADPDNRRVRPLILGGGQEFGRRSGTVNVAGAVGLGIAFTERAASLKEAVSSMAYMRDMFEDLLTSSVPCQVVGSNSPRVANTSNLMFDGLEAMAVAAQLDQRGVLCSVGSACSSGRPEPSHVLMAMGFSEAQAYSCVRFSFSVLNTVDEARGAAELVAEVVQEMRTR